MSINPRLSPMDQRSLAVITRLVRESDNYVQSCLADYLNFYPDKIPLIQSLLRASRHLNFALDHLDDITDRSKGVKVQTTEKGG
jgi:hypothetical protein